MNKEISGSTRLTCLLGHPVAHSISPKMHNTSFQKLGLDYAYLAFDATEDSLSELVQGLKAMNCKGFNLTMPLKTAIIPYLDELSEASQLCNSVNTVVNDSGRLIGYTTDGIGYMDSLRDSGFDITGGSMTLLGAGGAATSILVQAALDGVKEIFLFKRQNASYQDTVDFAKRVTENTNCKVTVFPMENQEALRECLAKSTILTNATNVGMGEDTNSLVPKEFLHKDLIVSDIIYHPQMTTLLKGAAELGCPYINGKYMLLFQGAAAFTLWTGEEMPVPYIKEECFS